MNRALKRVLDDPANPSPTTLPPEAEIFSPEWFQQIDPAKSSFDVDGKVYSRGAPYKCQLLVAPGQYPNNNLTTDSAPGDFDPVGNGWCDGSTTHSGAEAADEYSGKLGAVSLDELESHFPAGTDFTGPIPQPSEATANGRPFFAPHAFTFKVIVTPTTGPARTGEDERSAYLHHDADLLAGYPKAISDNGKITDGAPTSDGESSPAFADLNGDNRNELIFASADGFVHALEPDGSELPGWPVRSDPAPFFANHLNSRAYESGEIPTDRGAMFLASVAVGDPDHDGVPTVYAADYEGKVYGWDPDGNEVFEEEANPDYSGAPLQPFENVRNGKLNRTNHGFFGSPVLADIDGDGTEELVAASMDRHVYAWEVDDSDPHAPGGAKQVAGFPVLVVDPAKVQSVDPQTHAVTYKADANGAQQGGIIDTPAIGDLDGDGKPEIVVGTNEEYLEDPNASAFDAASLGVIAQTGILDPGNTRLYVLKSKGDTDGNPVPTDAIESGWPRPMALLLTELLPVVGEGITGPPVIGPVDCPSGGSGNKVGAISAAGPGYIFNPDGSVATARAPTARHHAADRRGRLLGGGRPPDPAGGRQPALRGLRCRRSAQPRLHHARDRRDPRRRSGPARVPAAGPGLRRRLRPDHGAVPAELPGDHERPAVPHRPVGRRHRRPARRGAHRGLREPGLRGLRQRRRAGPRLAEAVHGLDRRQPADRHLRRPRTRTPACTRSS